MITNKIVFVSRWESSLLMTLAILSLALFLCSSPKPPSAKIDVFVSILPQKYFLDKLGGGLLDVSLMVEPGASPHTYEPKPFQMVRLSKAKAYFALGLEFENAWLPKFAALEKNVRIVHTDTLIAKMPADSLSMNFQPAQGRREAAGREDEGLDPHIWLSPELVKQQAATMYGALRAIDPAHDSAYTANYQAFLSLIVKVQDSIKSIVHFDSLLTPVRPFLVFHPAWGYFAREFRLRQLAIEVEGKEPSARQMEDIIRATRQYGIRTIFVQPQFSQQSANAIARQIHGRLCLADDMAYDWAANLISFAKNIAAR